MNARNLAQCVGVYALLFGAGTIYVVILNNHVRIHGGIDLSRLWIPGVVFLLLGGGSVCLQEWALIPLALILLAAGLVLIVGPIFEVPFPGLFIDAFFGILCIASGVILLANVRFCRKMFAKRGRS
jgi:uncharacterized membrane protein HdeD (DUF308 family)